MKNFYWLFLTLIIQVSWSQNKTTIPSIEEKTQNMKSFEGFFTYFWEEETGKIWLKINLLDTEFLYINSLAAGVGSNDIGLDRGQLGKDRIVTFQKHGPKILMVQPNYTYRADSENEEEKKSVAEAFAHSVLAGFKIEAATQETYLVDLTDFLMQDAHGVSARLKRTQQGSYRIDPTRSSIYMERTKNFPENTEFEALLTFTGEPNGQYVYQVVPSPEAITVRQHHSFVKLPQPGYEPRAYDPRSGYISISYQDYATPIDKPLTKRWIIRHRLEKQNPAAASSPAVEPIVYYLDRGTPEPVRSALLDGARWWNEAFEAAGYVDAFRVEMLPAGADPLDVRYNVIQWVHRSTRGWSYGASVIDPRTGEIIKGHVSLGSLRVRQDYLIAQGLLAPYTSAEDSAPEMQEMALARLRQLSAHEVGHTLGLVHNFASSTTDRTSVMDYPHPYIVLDENQLNFSDAYDVGIGEWDKVAIAYGYQDFPEGTEEAGALDRIIEQSLVDGLRHITDQDARPAGSAHPYAHLWDNGASATEELARILEVRKFALDRFGENNIRRGEPLATLEEVLVPLYLSHRYQVEAVAKLLGGMYYTYALKGDGQQPVAMIPAEQQLEALEALLNTLTPEVLELPASILSLIPPHPPGFPRNREIFNNRTGSTFDPLAAASSSAHHTLSFVLHPQRAARLVELHARDDAQPGLSQVFDMLVTKTIQAEPLESWKAELQREVNTLTIHHLMHLALEQNAPGQVRALTLYQLQSLSEWLSDKSKNTPDTDWQAHYAMLANEIDRFLDEPEDPIELEFPDMPDGSPIGMSCQHLHCQHMH